MSEGLVTGRELIVKDTHRGLWYEDGVLVREIQAGRHVIPRSRILGIRLGPKVEVQLVDIRERDLTIKGQEILTSDKVAIRVSIIVQFRVTDARAALHETADYQDRLYSDVQLAARRSLASMTLEDILTNRTRLSEDILQDVKEAAATYGVNILRADVKDLIFPGNLQEIMNRVLTTERLSQALLVEARTEAQVQQIETDSAIEADKARAAALAETARRTAEAEAEIQRVRTAGEMAALEARGASAKAYAQHPALLRLEELETLRELAHNGNARIYIGFDKHVGPDGDDR